MERNWRSEFWPLTVLLLLLGAPMAILAMLQEVPRIACDPRSKQHQCEKYLSGCAQAIMGGASGTRDDFVQACLDRKYRPACGAICRPDVTAADIASKDPVRALLRLRNQTWGDPPIDAVGRLERPPESP
jgi:hypothetical protein